MVFLWALPLLRDSAPQRLAEKKEGLFSVPHPVTAGRRGGRTGFKGLTFFRFF
jgi:hypothetical protein